jgi:XTP/dITP diphosphohydrolase
MIRKFTGQELVIATHNHGKLEEIEHLFETFKVKIRGAGELGIIEPEETEDTFVGNARIKAHSAAKESQTPSLADDSGITIDALNGAPGVYTADWAETSGGRDFVYAMEKTQNALAEVDATHPRSAQFRCTLVLAWPDGHDEVFEGIIAGSLVWPMRGENGHGYDPIFLPDGYNQTFGEMDRWEKNRISHRADAFTKLLSGCF